MKTLIKRKLIQYKLAEDEPFGEGLEDEEKALQLK